ncbi:MAG: polysaccharide deacetylase family protein, partial [Candidatus Omnitrophica bacterium]|nr:polysaccharide deacetylase family protein [Candidatus Omnitrophota bacterium]
MSQTNARLGYPPDARLLIINADDFGMCHAVNEAIIGAVQRGLVRSTTLMVPCPWALHAVRFLRQHPEISFGVHLTVVSEWVDYRWGPVTPRGKVPSLITEAGYFHYFEQVHEHLAQFNLNELETEFRAQIEAVLAAGLTPTHLDWHSLRLRGGDPVSELMFRLAQDYGLALRVRGQSWIEEVHGRGFPCNDFDFLDSYHLNPTTKFTRFTELLRELPEGLSEWAVHPGLDNAELRAIDPGGSLVRQA